MRFGSSFNERSNSGLSEHDEFILNDSVFNTSTTSAASFNSATAGPNNLQRQIISMEDDEFADDQDLISGK